MAFRAAKSLAGFLLLLNLCMYVTVAAIAGWALNKAIDHDYVNGPRSSVPVGLSFSPVFFPEGNEATGFMVIFALIAGCCRSWLLLFRAPSSEGVDTRKLGFQCFGRHDSLGSQFSCHGVGIQGDPFACRSAKLIVLESFVIILCATKLFYMMLIHVGFFSGKYFSCGETHVATTIAEPVKESTAAA